MKETNRQQEDGEPVKKALIASNRKVDSTDKQ